MLRIFFPTVLNLVSLQMQNSPAGGGLKQLHLRALNFDKNGYPKKDIEALRINIRRSSDP
jgi:hypothetical protein